MRIITCDRCGATLPEPEYENAGYVSLQWRGIRTSELTENPFEDWDLCEDCFNEIEKYIKIKPIKIKQEEKFQKIVESVDAGKKPKEKKVDQGTVGALYDAGWTVRAIAKEVKCSDERVRQILREIRPDYPKEARNDTSGSN